MVDEARQGLVLAGEGGAPWYVGELAWWLLRAGAGEGVPARCAAPWALQIAGDWSAAAEAWAAVGCPYEQARALAEGDGDAPLQAWRVFDGLGARPAADALRGLLDKAARRRLPRVARPATAAQPFQLTLREVEVLALLCAGLKTAAIAERLVRSVRTVDHHVAAIYAKLGVNSRSEAVAAALRAGIGPAR
ncbi:MAG: helix-turn-helix transcriptional regulator [Rubrivivax sp.]